MEKDQDGGVLDPSATVDASGKTMLDVLKEKHLQPREAHESVFLPCDELPLLTCVDITGARLERLPGKSKEGWPRWDNSTELAGFSRYGSHSEQLKDAITELSRPIASTIIDWDDIQTLMACRLIALDKCPGVCPIGVGEVSRHILSKVMAAATSTDVEELCGTNQLYSGLKAGIEGVDGVV